MKQSALTARRKIRDMRRRSKHPVYPTYPQVTRKLEDDYEEVTGHKIWCTAGFNSQCQCGARPDLMNEETP